MEFYEILSGIMQRKGMSVADVARTCDLTDSTVRSIIDRKQKKIALNIAFKLATGLGVSLEELNGQPEEKNKAPSISDEALKIAKRYSNLDSYGKSTVRAVLEEEENRIEAQAKFDALAPENEPKVINLFLEPSAAGMALGTTGTACEPYELKPDDPQGTAYAVRLQGDSMSPHFPDGSIVFVNHDQMRDGDIGIFCVDGSTVCKQWHYDAFLNITYLFSLNRKREDADLVITGSSGRSLVWQGRVITKRRYPLPHER